MRERVTKFKVRDWWMRLHVAMDWAPPNEQLISNVLNEMEAASATSFHVCANCGKKMKHRRDKSGKKLKYDFVCECTPNVSLSIG